MQSCPPSAHEGVLGFSYYPGTQYHHATDLDIDTLTSAFYLFILQADVRTAVACECVTAQNLKSQTYHVSRLVLRRPLRPITRLMSGPLIDLEILVRADSANLNDRTI